MNKHPSITLRVLIKYFFRQGKDEKQVKEIIKNFMKKNASKYNPAFWEHRILSLVQKGKKDTSPLLEIDEIKVTQNELQAIASLENLNLEKLAFVILVYSKIYNIKNGTDTYWVNCSTKDIFSDCKIPIIKKKQELMIHELIQQGLLETSKKIDNTNLRVTFADNNSPVVAEVRSFRNFVYYYLRWKGHNIGDCECGDLFKVSGKNHKMCKVCWQDREKELRKAINKRYYANKNKN